MQNADPTSALILLALALGPTIIAVARRHPHSVAIAVLSAAMAPLFGVATWGISDRPMTGVDGLGAALAFNQIALPCLIGCYLIWAAALAWSCTTNDAGPARGAHRDPPPPRGDALRATRGPDG